MNQRSTIRAAMNRQRAAARPSPVAARESRATSRQPSVSVRHAAARRGRGAARKERLVLPLFQATKELASLSALDPVLARVADRALKERTFKGEMGEALLLLAPEPERIGSLLLLGLGQDENCTLETLRRGAAAVARRAARDAVKEFVWILGGQPMEIG